MFWYFTLGCMVLWLISGICEGWSKSYSVALWWGVMFALFLAGYGGSIAARMIVDAFRAYRS